MNCEAVGMCLLAGAVLSAETSDFLFNRRDLKVLSEDHVRHIPWRIGCHAQSFGLEAFQNLDVRGRSRSPELYAVGPDRLRMTL
jgi:hypothetical protein